MSVIPTYLVRRWHDIWDTRNPAIADEILTSDFVDHRLAALHPGLPPGPSGVKQAAAGVLSRSGTSTTRIDDLFALDDRIAARVTVRTNVADPVSGEWQSVEWTYREIFRVRDQRLAEHWEDRSVLPFRPSTPGANAGSTRMIAGAAGP